MKTFPATASADFSPSVKIPSIPAHQSLTGDSGGHSRPNRRISNSGPDRIYPILLTLSTLVAGTFCMLYITKPVRIIPQTLAPVAAAVESKAPAPAKAAPVTARPTLLPLGEKLPGEDAGAQLPPATTSPEINSPFEETNIRIQHVLNAEAPNGELSRIVLNVPVLYQSRNLRWTTQDVGEARELLNRLADYQEKSLALRAEGTALLASWNRLVEKSIPAADVRADSPSLPANQQDASDSGQSQELSTPNSIQIHPSQK